MSQIEQDVGITVCSDFSKIDNHGLDRMEECVLMYYFILASVLAVVCTLNLHCLCFFRFHYLVIVLQFPFQAILDAITCHSVCPCKMLGREDRR